MPTHAPTRRGREVDDRRVAHEFVRQHDAAAAAGAPVHRVTAHLAAPGPDTLRTDLLAFANGGPMSSALRCEVTAYQLCILDDTVQEAVHRDVTHISARAPASKLALRAATLRLDQNIELWDAATALGQDTDGGFQQGRTVAWGEGQRVMRPLRAAQFLDCVYRGGDVALRDWGALQPVMQATAADTAKERLAEGTKLKEEYLKAVFVQGIVVSFPVGVDNE
ncbi:MAG: hypothetical protein GY772_22105, partial [bacterium]|nr:hypothetical protein [bacterium]